MTVLLEPSDLATRPGAKQAKASKTAQVLPTFEDTFGEVFDDPQARMVFFRDLLEFLREFCAGLAEADEESAPSVSPRRVHRAAVRPGSTLPALAPPRKGVTNRARPVLVPTPSVGLPGPGSPTLVVPAASVVPVTLPAAVGAARRVAARTAVPQVAIAVPASTPAAAPAGSANPLLRVPPFVAKL